MDTGNGQRSKDPDPVIRDKEVRACGPLLDILVKVFEILHALFALGGVPLRELRTRGVV